jgi:hypothetical protein
MRAVMETKYKLNLLGRGDLGFYCISHLPCAK